MSRAPEGEAVLNEVWVEGLSRRLIREAKLFYQDPENVRAFEEWQRERKRKEGGNAEVQQELCSVDRLDG